MGVMDMVMEGHTDMDTGEEKRGMLMLWQLPLLMQMQMLIPGIHMEDMVLDIMDMVTTLDMEDIEDITDVMDTQDIMDTTDLMDMDMDMDTGDNHQFYDQKPQLPRYFLTTLT